MDAFEQFNSVGYVEKLKAQITLALVPTEHQALLEFLYNQSIHIWRYVPHSQYTHILNYMVQYMYTEEFCKISTQILQSKIVEQGFPPLLYPSHVLY